MQTALALLLFLTAKSRGLKNITHQRPAWMENLTPLSSMSQRGRRTDAALVFSLIFVWINVQAVLCRCVESCSQSVNLISVEVGHTAHLPPCSEFRSDSILSVMWGKGSCPTDKTIIIERNHNDEDGDTNEHFSVDEKYRLVIKNYNLDDAVEYWCEVTPRGAKGCSCSRTIHVKQVSETEYTGTTKQQQQQRGGTNMASSTSPAEQTFIQFQVFRNLFLLSGVFWLTNVGGMG